VTERSGDGPGEWEGDGEEKRGGPTTEERLERPVGPGAPGRSVRRRRDGRRPVGSGAPGQPVCGSGAATLEELPAGAIGAGVAQYGEQRGTGQDLLPAAARSAISVAIVYLNEHGVHARRFASWSSAACALRIAGDVGREPSVARRSAGQSSNSFA
jgi:hypothetical protein